MRNEVNSILAACTYAKCWNERRNKLNDFFGKTFQLAFFIDKLIFHKEWRREEEKSFMKKETSVTFPAFVFVSFLSPYS